MTTWSELSLTTSGGRRQEGRWAGEWAGERILELVTDAFVAGQPRPDSVVVVDARSGAIVYTNRYAERVVGRRLSDIADEFPMFHLDGSPYSLAERQVPRTLASGEQIVDEEFFGPAPDGGRIRWRCSCWPVHGDGGEIVAAVVVTRDVTEQARQREHLAHLAALLDNTDDAVIATDDRYRITVWNNGAERLYGWKASEVVGLHGDGVFRTSLSEEQRTELPRELAAHDRLRGQAAVTRKDGATVDVEVVSAGLRGQHGDITGYLGIHRDIGERKRADEELGRRAEQQALVVELGQRALASDDLQSLMDDAVALVARTLGVELAKVAELLSEGGEEVMLRAGVGPRAGFVGALSTSRRRFSPSDVSFVQAVANVLAGAVERGRAQERLGEVREAERSRIARDLHDEALRDLSDALVLAMGTGSVSDAPEAAARLARLVPVLTRVGEQLRGAIYDLDLARQEDAPFSERLRSLVSVHHAMAADADIELDLRQGVPAGPLGATGTEVLRIVGEALTNARRHAGARHIRVRASGSHGRLHAEVSDDGHGFDPGKHSAGADGRGITGMCERAELLHGGLVVSSDPSAGTTVRLEVPLQDDPERAGEQTRVLLVEDHAAVREAIASAFERDAGFQVAGQAASLAEARGLLEGVDVAVLDLGLPDGFGGDLISELRRVNAHAQALVLSATLDHAEVARAIESGAAGVLNKTAHLGEVVDAVRRLQAGETLMPLDEVVELLRFAGRKRERERADRQAIAQITPREREVLQALADGLSTEQIADRLHISIRTERNHVANILAKLGVHSRLQAVVLALRYQIVEVR